MNTYRGTGHRITVTAGADYASGDVFVVKSGIYGLIGIAVAAIANGATGDVQLEGVHELDAKSTDTGAIGATMYWDAGNGELTTTSTDNTLAGILVAAKTNGQTTAKVKINGCPVTLTGAATLTGTEELTNKTITSPTITTPVITSPTLTFTHTVTPVAAAGSTVADAGALSGSQIVHITSDSAAKGVKLPAVTAAGKLVIVVNNSSTAAELYAESTGTVNGLSADASVVVPASKGLLCISTAAKTWIAFDLTAKATAS